MNWLPNAIANEAEFRAILRLLKVAQKGIPVEKMHALYTDTEFDGWRILAFVPREGGLFMFEWCWQHCGSRDVFEIVDGEAVHKEILHRWQDCGSTIPTAQAQHSMKTDPRLMPDRAPYYHSGW